MPNWRNCAGLALGFTALSAAAGAAPVQPPAAPLHYIGSVEFKPEIGAMGAGWTVIIKDESLTSIEFALTSAFGTALVSGPGVQTHSTAPDPRNEGSTHLYSIDLTPSIAGAPRVVKFSYGGPMFPNGAASGINTLDSKKIELTVDSYWFPFDTRFDTGLTAQVNVRIDGEWSAVGVGTMERTAQGYHFEQDRPSIDIALSLLSSSVKIIAPGYVIHDARTVSGEKMTELTDALEGCTAYLNTLSGTAGPLPQATIIVTDRPEGGYSRGTLIALTDIENEDEEALRQFICHELAHYWSQANAGGPENWINEGIADYLANMGVRDAMGDDVFDARMARYADQVSGQSLPPIWTANATDRLPYLTLYRAAPLALRDLEDRIGKAQFSDFMQAAMTARISSTVELLALLEDMSGLDVRDWFEARLAD